MHRIALPLLAVLCSLVLLQCALFGPDEPSVLQCSVPPSSGASTDPPPCSTPPDRREAQLLAVWLTGELRPAPRLTRRLCRDLGRLRQEFADAYPVVASRFQAAWVSGKLTLRFDSAAAQAIRENRYEGWSRLPSFLHPDTLLDLPDERGWSWAGFDEVYHMGQVGARYETSGLPGLLVSGPTGRGFTGYSTYPILPLWNGETLGLVFPRSTAGPPSIFFRICNGQPAFVDEGEQGENEPRWLREAWAAWEERGPQDS